VAGLLMISQAEILRPRAIVLGNYSVNQHSLKIIRRIVSSYNVDAHARTRASQTYRQLYIKKGREGETSKLKGAITVKFLSSARESRDKAAR